MKLAQKRCEFTEAKLNLELFLNIRGRIEGFYFAIGEAKRPRDAIYGHPQSCHKDGLAVHFLIYDKNYGWMAKTDPERRLRILNMAHDEWEKLGGAIRIEWDLHHFSFEHNGII